MQHIEFFDKEHFLTNYHREKPPAALSDFIEFYWETRFENLWKKYPEGFSDALFPNIGYTYLFNLGTPFVMQVGNEKFNVNKDSFLPRSQSIECYHQSGNKIFGIKFRISPEIFHKKINFSEYNSAVIPLSYMLEKKIADEIKAADNFKDRVQLLNKYFLQLVQKEENTIKPITIVTAIIDHCNTHNLFSIPISQLAEEKQVSSRTLQRYFEQTTSLSSKKTLQILRIRKAVEHLASGSPDFNYTMYGYYDLSHFTKHLKQFMEKALLSDLQKKIRIKK